MFALILELNARADEQGAHGLADHNVNWLRKAANEIAVEWTDRVAAWLLMAAATLRRDSRLRTR